MELVQDEAIRAISTAISGADGDLLSVVARAQEKWKSELHESKAAATTLLARVLNDRQSMRSSLDSGAKLWHTLRPTDNDVIGGNLLSQKPQALKEGCFVATDHQTQMVRALQNVSHTILITEFVVSAPEALESAESALAKIMTDGLEIVAEGNAALLVNAHANLTAVERLRDLIRLESSLTMDSEAPLSVWFSKAAKTRVLLEDIVLEGLFAKVVPLSQKNPRLLVSAARVVEAEEVEDEWWNAHAHRCGKAVMGARIRSFGARQYKKRALNAIVKSLQSQFHETQIAFGLDGDGREDRNGCRDSGTDGTRQVKVRNILDWIQHRRYENDTVRRFVSPCLPPSFNVSGVFEKELHRQFMRLLTQILQLVKSDGSMMLTETDLTDVTSWYCQYKEEEGDKEEGLDSFLTDFDRTRLINALQRHCGARISSKITSTLAFEKVNDENGLVAVGNYQEFPGSYARRSSALCRTDLPDIILGFINQQVSRMLALKVRGLDQAIAFTVADCLVSFQKDVRQSLAEENCEEGSDDRRLYFCATANNMARCLECSEDLRDMFVPLKSDLDRSDIEQRMEKVIDGFRSTASMAVQNLIDGILANLRSHASRLYAPHTGTEIILDMVATLEDYFSDYEIYLLPYHFEYLAIESLKRVVVWYLAPFLRLAHHGLEESAARRFISLPTFGDGQLRCTDMQSDDYANEFVSRRSNKDETAESMREGLAALNGTAVLAQIDKDISNLTGFIEKKVILYQKKQLHPTLEPLHAIRSLYRCPPTTFALADAYREAKTVIDRALRAPFVLDCGVGGHFGTRIAEVIWESRADVNPIVLLEAVNVIRAGGDRMESASPSRMSSFDDGRLWGSRNSDIGTPFSERLLGKDASFYEHAGSSSSLLWTPSVSRSSRSNRRYATDASARR